MASLALERWQVERARQLDDLFAAHAALGGAGSGRRWRTAELNRALVLGLASHFQGFAKDLHKSTAFAFGRLVQPTDARVAAIFAGGLQVGRALDRQNANEESLGSDFSRFGLDLWAAMEDRDRRVRARRERLRWFNRARNAVAHDDRDKLAAVDAAGYPITLRTVRRGRSTLDALAGTMDVVVVEHLAGTFGTRPW
ncbi:MAG: hypothetical protein ACRDZR_02920 [Acidimicrobiales bacterium]